MDADQDAAQRAALDKECRDIVQDCDLERKKNWNERDKLSARVDQLKHTVLAVRTLQTAFGTAAVLQAAKTFPLGDWPFSFLTIVTIPLLALGEAFLQTQNYQSWGEHCHSTAAEFYALRVQTERFRRVQLPFLPIAQSLPRVEELHQVKLDIGKRAPQRVFCSRSYSEAQESIRQGGATYDTELPQPSSSSSSN